jgi:hypothetical protein
MPNFYAKLWIKQQVDTQAQITSEATSQEIVESHVNTGGLFHWHFIHLPFFFKDLRPYSCPEDAWSLHFCNTKLVRVLSLGRIDKGFQMVDPKGNSFFCILNRCSTLCSEGGGDCLYAKLPFDSCTSHHMVSICCWNKWSVAHSQERLYSPHITSINWMA